MPCRRTRFDSWVRKMPWRKERKPTPVFFPGQPHGQRSLAGYSPWGQKELDTTERLTFFIFTFREGGDRGWDGWMASPTQWKCIWANPGRWWRTGKPIVIQSTGSQRVWLDWVTDWTTLLSSSLGSPGGASGRVPVQETEEGGVWSRGREDPLEKEMTTHSSVLVWRIPWTEKPGGYNP